LFFNSCIEQLSDKELIVEYQKAFDNQNWAKALSCVEEGLKRTPTDTALYFSKAYCLTNSDRKLNNAEIIKSLEVYLNHYKRSIRGRLLKYTNHYENKDYPKAILEVNYIEKYYGISANTLLMKANAFFLAKNYKEAAFYYEEVLSFELPVANFKPIYYYKIYAKYFSGNIEGALWDTAFLLDNGLPEDRDLMKLIENKQIDAARFQTIPFVYEAEQFAKDIRIETSLEYDAQYSPFYGRMLFEETHYNISDLKTLNKEIRILNLYDKGITELPDEIKKFKNLKAINLSRNSIRDFDRLFLQLAALDSLEYLVLDYSNLKNFPKSIGKLKQLKGLSVQASNLSALPREIGDLYNLSYLSIRNNGKFLDLPKEIKYLKNLNVLDVSGSGIQRLRNELSLCYNLFSIKANASRIKTLPRDIGNLKHLRNLNLAANKIVAVPESIGDITFLQDLSLGSNEIKSLPNSISKLQDLQILSLHYNRFKEFPNEVLTVENLQTLWVHNNNIPVIPASIDRLKKLTHLLVDHEIITDENIRQLKEVNAALYIIKNDCRKYVGGARRKN
jgi:hypothetical protein